MQKSKTYTLQRLQNILTKPTSTTKNEWDYEIWVSIDYKTHLSNKREWDYEVLGPITWSTP